jgi:hypothetical protein
MRDSLEDVIPLYTKIADYEARTAFVGPIYVEPGNLDKIVGKIELPAKPEHDWAHCGLNNCNTAHRFGYVIRTKDGLETNCGRDCGAREFGVLFEEVVARAKVVEESAARRRAAMEVVVQAPGWLAQLAELLPQVEREDGRLLEFEDDFKSHKSFWNELHKIAKGSAVIKAPTWTEYGLVNETLGRIEGCSLLLRSRVWSSATIKDRLIPWVESLTPQSVETINQEALVDIVRRAENVQRILREAPVFVEDVRRLLSPKNFELFDKMSLRGLCRITKEGWGDLIRKWTGPTLPMIKIEATAELGRGVQPRRPTL